MKNSLVTALLCLVFLPGFAQSSGYEFQGQLRATVSKEKLPFGKSIHDINPEFCRYMALPPQDAFVLDQRIDRQKIYLGCALPQFLKVTGSPQGKSQYVQKDFDDLVHYVSVEVSAVSGGKIRTAQGKSAQLTPEQNFILAKADMGSEVRVKVFFRYKEEGSKVNEGEFGTTVVPEHEAQFPGGVIPMTKYLKKNVSDKIAEAVPKTVIQQAQVVFTVDETGKIVDAAISSSSTNLKADKIILDAIRKMPKWSPASTSKGLRVRQQISFPFGSQGGC